MADALHSIQLAAKLTGLSPYVIRIWEQRYRAVEPLRTGTNRRLYSQPEIERLRLLRELTQAGHNIGQVAQLPDRKLRELASTAVVQSGPPAPPFGKIARSTPSLDECLAAIESLDVRTLDNALRRAGISLGAQGVLHALIAPLSQKLGDLWRDGRITAAHEHFATGIIRGYLTNLGKPFGGNESAPTLVVATPAAQLHELGALLVAAAAANLGWQVTHLGASLPAAEIAGAARQQRARAVALSLVYPEDDPRLPAELKLLRASLPAETAVLVGGRAATAYRDSLADIGATLVPSLTELGVALDRLRRPKGRNAGELKSRR